MLITIYFEVNFLSKTSVRVEGVPNSMSALFVMCMIFTKSGKEFLNKYMILRSDKLLVSNVNYKISPL